MAETPYFKFRLPPNTLADLNALAASNGGNNSLALKEAVAYWRDAVEVAAKQNADDLSRDEWTLLGHTGDPSDCDLPDEANEGSLCRDWAHLIAIELSTMYDGRLLMLPSHKEEERAAKKLAKKIAGWGIIRGYALMSALRYFWRHQEAGITACALPEIWMTPTARE